MTIPVIAIVVVIETMVLSINAFVRDGGREGRGRGERLLRNPLAAHRSLIYYVLLLSILSTRSSCVAIGGETIHAIPSSSTSTSHKTSWTKRTKHTKRTFPSSMEDTKTSVLSSMGDTKTTVTDYSSSSPSSSSSSSLSSSPSSATHNMNLWTPPSLLVDGTVTSTPPNSPTTPLTDDTTTTNLDGRGSGNGRDYHVDAYDGLLTEVRSRLVSTTLLMKLSPFEKPMDDTQTIVYETGLNQFLVEQFIKMKETEEEDYDLEILDIVVIRNQIKNPMNYQQQQEQQQTIDDDNHSLYIESVITAENAENSTHFVSSALFGELVSKYCHTKYDDLIQSLQMVEDVVDPDRSYDPVFGHILDLDVQSIHPSEYNSEGKEVIGVRAKFMLAIAVSILAACGIFICFKCLSCIRGKNTKQQSHNMKGSKDVHMPQRSKNHPSKFAGSNKSRKKGGVNYDIVYEEDSKSIHLDSYRDDTQQQPSAPPPPQSEKETYGNTPLQAERVYDTIDVNPIAAPLYPPPPRETEDYGNRPFQASRSRFYMNDNEMDEYTGSTCSSITTNTLRWKPSIKKECNAPAGKLGVSLDTVDGQPVIYNIKKGSPLFGILQPLDIIVGVDEVNTSSMSATEVTVLMAKKIRKKRKITFVRMVDE